MCGIAGIVGAGPGERVRDRADAMNRCLVHRGPDDHGIWAGDDGALAMRRLSIIDLAGGRQPMVSDAGSVLVFNGEIYNYRALRRELSADGWRFRTAGDTEVVLALVELHGIAAIDRLEGMFAFAFLEPGRRLHLVRDRLGKKPLYYTADGPLLFASELKGLLAGLERRPALDRQALHDYLSLRYVPAPQTPWEGVRKLAAGERLEFDLRDGARRVSSWWSLRIESATTAAADPHRRFAELLLGAVDKRLLAADVPVGVLLSGGLDSSAVAAAAVELGHRDFHTFSVGFDEGGDFSELPHARSVADHIGSRHHEVRIGRREFLAALPELVHMTDEPLADLATIPLHAVSRLAREHVKVVLSGEGADEVLAGYELERFAARAERLRPLRRVPGPLLRAAGAALPASRGEALATMARHGWADLARARRLHLTWVFDDAAKARLWREPGDLRPTEEIVDGWYAEAASAQPVDQLLQVACRSWLPEDLLMKADKATMAASLELRTPFLDHHLVEWAGRVPLEYKVGSRSAGWRSKRILRDFAASRLPAAILERPKRGFPVPAYRWLTGDLAPWARERLLRPDGPLAAAFDVATLEPDLDAAAAGDGPAAHRVWAMIVLGEWLERWT